jgi:hypothetical protein
MSRRVDPPPWSSSDWRPPATVEPAGSAPVPSWVRQLVLLMDGAFRIPGTEFRIGLDPILGFLLPGAGDVLGALPSLLIVIVAIRRGVPGVVVQRMLLNVAIDALVGVVPLFGDVFDAAYRSNQKNLALLERHLDERRRPRLADYLVVGLALAVVGSLVLIPPLLVVVLLKSILGN